ncbi:phage portal protein family protein [Agrobacterium pusense]|uniref:DUF935 family protein n=1 Tax=Agrobacterium pusense TaxID=648995 RepID=A0AA44J1T8_9HYPH|nr:DUF935 family protein [Agrobacterium pusense]NRF12157.1 DUF935 family protein [Agrobacterium pusense]NRF22867.1 DUF935 family protein [Agrobacterium pusense]
MKSTTKAAVDQPRKNLPANATNLIADARNDITIPFYSGALQHQDDTLLQRGGGKGLKIYDEIVRDTHAGSMLDKRKKVLLARNWEVKPCSETPLDVAAADFCREVINDLSFDLVCEELLDATLKGFAVSEVVWMRKDNRIVPEKIVTHDQRRFSFGEDWRPRLLTWTNMRDGIELPERKYIVHRFGVKGNNPYGLGLGSRLFWPVLFKREGITFWLHFLEKFASPTVIGFTPYGTLPEEQAKLMNTLRQLRSSSALTAPIGTDIKFLEAARSGSVTYQDFLEYWDKQISICVTGETLTTDIGSSGSRAASETHAEMLELLVDSDADLLSGTLRKTLLTWLVEYNFPGAGVPHIWRVRAKNEKDAAEVGKAKAEAATAINDALMAVLATAGQIDDDDFAREYITSFGLTDHLSEKAIDALVEARFAFMEGGKRSRDLRKLAEESSMFAALFDGAPKKKLQRHDHDASFAEENGRIETLSDQLEATVERHFNRRLDAIREALDAPDFRSAQKAILSLAAVWSPSALATQIGDGLELAALQGREAAFLDGETEEDFADADVINQPFHEQIEFFRQKRVKPTKAWTDALRGVHDRAFVIAGATDTDMLTDFQNAIARAMEEGTGLEQFAKDFDRIVQRYGWQYKGERGWRTRVIFETNMRSAYMAGRLKQMRDPDVVKLRPYMEYRHGETRQPKIPRPFHQAWHGLVLRYDDPWWNTHFPPNDWLCSCGVRSLSLADLKRRGKDGPDMAPGDLTVPLIDPVSGKLIEQPQGIGYGWDYMPGDLWERGLVPSALTSDGSVTLENPLQPVEIDIAESVEALLKRSKPFKAKPLRDDVSREENIRSFLTPFGADLDQAVLFEDKAGHKLPISDQLFRGGDDTLTGDHADLTPLLAEAMMDPDEIWVGVARRHEKSGDAPDELVVNRRYVRADRKSGLMIAVEMGDRFWSAVVARGRDQTGALDMRRNGKLVFQRSKK